MVSTAYTRPVRPARRLEVSLDDKYLLGEGRILLTGVQGLVRLVLDQHRADRARGLTTGTMISGYQGSPLGGFDQELARNADLLDEHHVRHVPALNEELGATSAWGSQLAAGSPAPVTTECSASGTARRPGLDRAADALRHGNFVGVSRTGGGLAVVGDDPSCKSSTIPSSSEPLLASLHMPVFFPGSVQEVLDLGLHAVCLLARLGPVGRLQDRDQRGRRGGHRRGRPGAHRSGAARPLVTCTSRPATCWRPSLSTWSAPCWACAPIWRSPTPRENGVNRIEGARDAWLGIVAGGKPYFDLLHALRNLGLGDNELDRAGIRILKLGMVWPLEREIAREFARGLDEVLVVEEKGPFVETALKEALYGGPHTPRVVGKSDERGERLLPMELDLDADVIARAVAARLGARVQLDSVEAHIRRLDAIAGRRAELPMALRSPFFCSGCPHNSLAARPGGHARGRRHRLPHDGRCSAPRARASSPASRRWAARAPSGSGRRPSPATPTWCRTWATARSTTPARWP